jgi:hypothetical protein
MVSLGWGSLVSPSGLTPSVAFTEPRVPLEEVLGSGRAVMPAGSVQATANTAKRAVIAMIFIKEIFNTITIKKSGHGKTQN